MENLPEAVQAILTAVLGGAAGWVGRVRYAESKGVNGAGEQITLLREIARCVASVPDLARKADTYIVDSYRSMDTIERIEDKLEGN